MNFKKGTEICFSTTNEPGVASKVTTALAESGLNITAFSAWGFENEGFFCCVTDNNDRAFEAIKGLGFNPAHRDVWVTDLQNVKGTLADFTTRLGNAGVNIDHIYGSSFGSGNAQLVVCVQDIDKAEQCLR